MPYSAEQIIKINSLTTDFYQKVNESFSVTRQNKWDGWLQCLPYLKNIKTLLDLGCGNRRFTSFLNDNNIDCNVDNIDNFLWDEKVQQVDIVKSLLEDTLNLKEYDVAVCFGLMHHIPGYELRKKLIKELSKSSIVIISFWQFMNNDKLAQKAISSTAAAKEKFSFINLEDNDFFLNWQDREDVFRYCHNFTNNEINELTLDCKLNILTSFNADGASNDLNKYLILNNNSYKR